MADVGHGGWEALLNLKSQAPLLCLGLLVGKRKIERSRITLKTIIITLSILLHLLWGTCLGIGYFLYADEEMSHETVRLLIASTGYTIVNVLVFIYLLLNKTRGKKGQAKAENVSEKEGVSV
jgi:hypothetical protein